MKLPVKMLCLLFTIGCAVGPNYKTPDLKIKNEWASAKAMKEKGLLSASENQLKNWWKNFGDPQLDQIIEKAIQNNLDLKIADSRVQEELTYRRAAFGKFLPQLDATGSYVRSKSSERAGFGNVSSSLPGQTIPGITSAANLWSLGLESSWELDFFGGNRRAYQAAAASFESIREERRDVWVRLLADISLHYIDYRSFQQRLKIAEQNLEAQRAALKITESRFKSGLTSELDVAQANALVSTSESQVPILKTGVIQSRNRLTVLLGLQPGAAVPELEAEASMPSHETLLWADLPSNLLTRRPDVRMAIHRLEEATARIGAAKADYFPRVSLVGGFGLQANKLGDLTSSQSQFWSVGPAIRWPIFAAGRIRANVKAKTEKQKQRLYEYEKTVLTALEETENSMVALVNEVSRSEKLQNAVDHHKKSVDLSQKRYINGLSDFLNVVQAQQALFDIEDRWVQSRRSVNYAVIHLYKALGGGWEATQL